MQKKRVVHIISSLKMGGAESLLVDLIGKLPEYEHVVICFHDGPNREKIELLGVQAQCVKGLFFRYDPFFWVNLVYVIIRLKPDLIHSGLWVANLVARVMACVLRVPNVSVLHLDVNCDGVIRNLIDTITFRLSYRVIAVSDQIAASLERKAWIPAKKIQVIKNGIEQGVTVARSYEKFVTKERLGIPEYAFVVGSVGRFISRKNYKLLLDSFAELTEHHKYLYLVLVGFGPLEIELRSYAQSLGIATLVRFIVNEPAYSYYPVFNCFVLPSAQEGISVALLEAMCFGLACVTTAVNDKHEVIQHKHNGLLVPSNDRKKLTMTLKGLLGAQDEIKRLGQEAYKTVTSTYEMSHMVNAYRTVFEDMFLAKNQLPKRNKPTAA